MLDREFNKRIRTTQKKLQHLKVDALLVTNPINIRYLTAFTGTSGQLFITKKKAFFITDFRYIATAKKNIPGSVILMVIKEGLVKTLLKLSASEKISVLGIEERHLTYQKYLSLKKELKNLKLKLTKQVVEELRTVKSNEELRNIEKALRISEKVFLEVRKKLKSGKSEQEIAWEIEKLGHKYGADGPSFPPIVGFQQNTASPHHRNSPRKLKKGDLVLIDMGMAYRGYCSDITRMIFTKEPTPLQDKTYRLVLKAQEKVILKLKANVTGSAADSYARDIIKKAGYSEHFGHALGHGIGLEVHENPTLSIGFDKRIPENSVVTVEPGIYHANSFGIRIEDMILVKSKRATNLTRIPKKLEDCIFHIR